MHTYVHRYRPIDPIAENAARVVAGSHVTLFGNIGVPVLCCSVLQCVAVCCIVPCHGVGDHRVPVVWHSVAAYCSVLQQGPVSRCRGTESAQQYTATRYNILL